MDESLLRALDELRRRGAEINIRIPPAAETAKEKPTELTEPTGKLEDLSSVDQRILCQLSHDPIPVKALAKKCGYKYNSHFRAVLRDLWKRGLVKREPHGVSLP